MQLNKLIGLLQKELTRMQAELKDGPSKDAMETTELVEALKNGFIEIEKNINRIDNKLNGLK
jgi:hypothetical protein